MSHWSLEDLTIKARYCGIEFVGKVEESRRYNGEVTHIVISHRAIHELMTTRRVTVQDKDVIEVYGHLTN